MNYPIAIVFALMCLGFIAHITGGVIQSLSTEPAKIAGTKRHEDASLESVNRNWLQSMCAFQLVSVDILAIAGVLYLLAFTEALAPRQAIGFAVAALFLLWGISWVVQLAALKSKPKDYLILSHWAVWFLCAGLVYWGSLSL